MRIKPQKTAKHREEKTSIIVMGGGVVGMTSAYWLAKSGYHVQVVDKEQIGRGTSYANAGYFAYSSGVPFPSFPILTGMVNGIAAAGANALKSLWEPARDDTPKLRPVQVHWKESLSDPEFWKWGFHFFKGCALRKSWSERGAEWSRMSDAAMTKLLSWGEIRPESFNFRRCGALRFYPNGCDMSNLQEQVNAAKALGHSAGVVSAVQAATIEKALLPFIPRIGAAIHFKGDASADCFKYVQEVARVITQKYQVKLIENTEIKALRFQGDKLTGLETADGKILTADIYVLALGPESSSLAQTAGLDLPIYPLKGYSITLEIPEEEMENPELPGGVIIDASQSLYISRLGPYLRFTSYGEFSGSGNDKMSLQNIRDLKLAAKSFLKHSAIVDDVDMAQVWMGKRPASPDGLPIVSACKFTNLFINTGHGAHGWKMACSSAEHLACLITTDHQKQKRKGAINLSPMSSVEISDSSKLQKQSKNITKVRCGLLVDQNNENVLSLDRFL